MPNLVQDPQNHLHYDKSHFFKFYFLFPETQAKNETHCSRRFDYFNTFYFGIDKPLPRCLQTLQNAAANILTGKK